jgi:uncharacterized protein with HEPN domain
MRPERLYLIDILEAAESIHRFTGGVQESDFLQNDMLQSAVLQKLTIIGEAASKLGSGFTAKHPQVPWRDIVGFRNIAVHAYFSVEWPIVWVAATEETPALRDQVAAIVAREFPVEES